MKHIHPHILPPVTRYQRLVTLLTIAAIFLPSLQVSAQKTPDTTSFSALLVPTTVIVYYPIIPSVWFDLDSASIPARYHQFDSYEETIGWDESMIEGGELERQLHLLNVVGGRMRRDTGVAIQIDGYCPRLGRVGHETCDEERAAHVADYLTDVWNIAPERVAIRGRGRDIPTYSSTFDVEDLLDRSRIEFWFTEFRPEGNVDRQSPARSPMLDMLRPLVDTVYRPFPYSSRWDSLVDGHSLELVVIQKFLARDPASNEYDGISALQVRASDYSVDLFELPLMDQYEIEYLYRGPTFDTIVVGRLPFPIDENSVWRRPFEALANLISDQMLEPYRASGLIVDVSSGTSTNGLEDRNLVRSMREAKKHAEKLGEAGADVRVSWRGERRPIVENNLPEKRLINNSTFIVIRLAR